MPRRRVLVGVGAAATTALAGCLDGTPLAAPADLSWTAEEVQIDGREHHQIFGGVDRPAVVTVRQESFAATDSVSTVVPFFLVLHHREDLRTDALRLRLRARSRNAGGEPGAVYVESPPTDRRPPLTVTRAENGWTAVDCGDLGRPVGGPGGVVPGVANVRVDFAIRGRFDRLETLDVEVEAVLSESGPVGRRRFRLAHAFAVPVVTG